MPNEISDPFADTINPHLASLERAKKEKEARHKRNQELLDQVRKCFTETLEKSPSFQKLVEKFVPRFGRERCELLNIKGALGKLYYIPAQRTFGIYETGAGKEGVRDLGWDLYTEALEPLTQPAELVRVFMEAHKKL